APVVAADLGQCRLCLWGETAPWARGVRESLGALVGVGWLASRDGHDPYRDDRGCPGHDAPSGVPACVARRGAVGAVVSWFVGRIVGLIVGILKGVVTGP